MKKYVVEFIGAFFLFFTVGVAAVLGTAGDLAPLAIGSVLMVMIFAGGHISGGHFNPAVTLAVWIRGRCEVKDVIPYMVSQILGAVVAAFVALQMKSDVRIEAFSTDGQVLPIFLAEFLFTFALAYVVLNVATAKANEGNSYFGLAIGFTVLVGAFTVGSISLGAFNPAVVIGLLTMGKLGVASLWIYLAATFGGGAVAAFVFKSLNTDDK